MPAWTAGSLTIHYETAGPEDGPAVLLLAPGGMRSTAERWAQIGFDALSLLPQLGFRAIAMDQRNAGGASTGPIDDDCGWSQYAQDQIALLDQLGIDRCHLLGCCIGGAFILKLFSVAPARFGASVLMQPIGATAENQTVFRELFDGWSA
ncbi:MAG: alpha/beta hydrolase, partial [Myxococcota bacterium]